MGGLFASHETYGIERCAGFDGRGGNLDAPDGVGAEPFGDVGSPIHRVVASVIAHDVAHKWGEDGCKGDLSACRNSGAWVVTASVAPGDETRVLVCGIGFEGDCVAKVVSSCTGNRAIGGHGAADAFGRSGYGRCAFGVPSAVGLNANGGGSEEVEVVAAVAESERGWIEVVDFVVAVIGSAPSPVEVEGDKGAAAFVSVADEGVARLHFVVAGVEYGASVVELVDKQLFPVVDGVVDAEGCPNVGAVFEIVFEGVFGRGISAIAVAGGLACAAVGVIVHIDGNTDMVDYRRNGVDLCFAARVVDDIRHAVP